MTDIARRLVGLANSLGGDDEDIIMAGVAEIARLTGLLAEWENHAGPYKDAEIERLQSCLYAQESVPALYKEIERLREAADEIEQWRSRFEKLQAVAFSRAAEIERLRAALLGVQESTDLDDAHGIARRALEPKP